MARCAGLVSDVAASVASFSTDIRGRKQGSRRVWAVQADSSCVIVRSLASSDGSSSGMGNAHSGLRLIIPLQVSSQVSALGKLRGSRKFQFAVQASAGGDGESAGFGLGGPGTWFGFGKRQERQVGRLAMIGFVAAIGMEVLTGKGIFGQLGLDPTVVRFPFLAGLAFLFVGGLLGGSVVINNPPDVSKAPPNEGAGIARDPLKTYDPNYLDPLTTYTRGGVSDRPNGQKGREPYVSDLDEAPKKPE